MFHRELWFGLAWGVFWVVLLLIFSKCMQGHTFFLLPQDPIGPGQVELSLANTMFYEQYCPPSFVQQPGTRSWSSRVAIDQITM